MDRRGILSQKKRERQVCDGPNSVLLLLLCLFQNCSTYPYAVYWNIMEFFCFGSPVIETFAAGKCICSCGIRINVAILVFPTHSISQCI